MHIGKFDLQLFAENVGEVVATPQTSEPITTEQGATPQAFDYENATRDERRAEVMRYFADSEPVVTPAPQEQQAELQQSELQQAEQTVEPSLEIPPKFLNVDGTPNVEALVKSYINAEKKIGEQGNRMGQQGQQVQQLMARLQEMEAASQQPQAQNVPLEQSQPEAFDSDRWFEKFYESPKEALQDLLQGTMSESLLPQLQKLEPVVNYFERQQEMAFWESKVGEVEQKYPDFGEYRQKAAEILQNQSPEFLNLPNVIETAYLMAKAEVLDAKRASQPNLETLLKDQNFLQELSKNPELQKVVMKTYSQEINKEPKPTLIGSQAGGGAPMNSPSEIRSTRDATKAFKAYLMGGQG